MHFRTQFIYKMYSDHCNGWAKWSSTTKIGGSGAIATHNHTLSGQFPKPLSEIRHSEEFEDRIPLWFKLKSTSQSGVGVGSVLWVLTFLYTFYNICYHTRCGRTSPIIRVWTIRYDEFSCSCVRWQQAGARWGPVHAPQRPSKVRHQRFHLCLIDERTGSETGGRLLSKRPHPCLTNHPFD